MLSLRSDSAELSRRSQFSIELSWVALYIGRMICEQKIVVGKKVTYYIVLLLWMFLYPLYLISTHSAYLETFSF